MSTLFLRIFLYFFLGYEEIARLLINSASDSDCVKRMLETIDMEGDTVSLLSYMLILIT